MDDKEVIASLAGGVADKIAGTQRGLANDPVEKLVDALGRNTTVSADVAKGLQALAGRGQSGTNLALRLPLQQNRLPLQQQGAPSWSSPEAQTFALPWRMPSPGPEAARVLRSGQQEQRQRFDFGYLPHGRMAESLPLQKQADLKLSGSSAADAALANNLYLERLDKRTLTAPPDLHPQKVRTTLHVQQSDPQKARTAIHHDFPNVGTKTGFSRFTDSVVKQERGKEGAPRSDELRKEMKELAEVFRRHTKVMEQQTNRNNGVATTESTSRTAGTRK